VWTKEYIILEDIKEELIFSVRMYCRFYWKYIQNMQRKKEDKHAYQHFSDLDKTHKSGRSEERYTCLLGWPTEHANLFLLPLLLS
jgi:hypothetical protein